MSYPYPLRNISGEITADFDSIIAQNTTVVNFNGAGANGIPTYTTLTGSGNYTTPVGTKFIIVEAVGGGGSGGFSGNNSRAGGGGGGGAFFRKLYQPGTYAYSVGTGGASVSVAGSGNNGGNTTFDSDIAGGGVGGVSSALVGVYGNGGAGGTCSVTDEIISFNGGGGGAGFPEVSARGGSSFFGKGSGQVYYVSGTTPVPSAGVGAGGGGGYRTNVFSAAGGDGSILVTEYS